MTEASSGARGRHSRSARARSETGARLTPRAMASLLRSRSALQRASSALRARVVGVRPVPAISSIVIATGVFDASAERARFPGDGCPDVGTASRAHARVFPARVAARTRSPPRPRGRPARPDRARHRLAPLGFLAVWANSQDERLFLVDFSRRGEATTTRAFSLGAASRDARLFVHARHTTYPRLTRSLSSFPSTSPKRRATTSAGRTATRCPCSWMAWRRTCRKA